MKPAFSALERPGLRFHGQGGSREEPKWRWRGPERAAGTTLPRLEIGNGPCSALALARAFTYRRVMADAIMKRQVTALIGRCYAGLDVADLRDEVLRRLRRIVSVDAAFFGTIDPQTLLFTSAVG